MFDGVAPHFDELPLLANGLRAAWGAFGEGDELGTANRLTPSTITSAAAEEIRTGQRINLCLPLSEPDPPMFGRAPLRHTIFNLNPDVQDDVIDNFYPQASTQWDGLRHRKDPEFGFYGGVSDEDAGPHGSRLGINVWAEHGLVGRAILADIAGYFEASGEPFDSTTPFVIEANMIEDALTAQGTEIRRGDILLLRTGYIESYLSADVRRRHNMRDDPKCAGLSPDESMARFLWDSGFAAIAADNPGVEVLPRDPSKPYLHSRLLPMLGFAMGEFFNLADLRQAASSDGRYSCFFCSIPLNLPKGVGSPANAIAIR